MMTKKERAHYVQKVLDRLYPRPSIPLDHRDRFTLLIAVLLSAQCTDKRVNLVTPQLFNLADTPEKMCALEISKIEEIIKTCGLAPTKAKNIWNLSKQLLEQYGGEIPQTLEELESLPGVGHKTASVVLCQGFNIPAFPVDTHIHRCARRWKLSRGKNVKQTEENLKNLFPEKSWSRLHLQIIYFGREYCKAKGHCIDKCPLCSRLA